jgi:hypothetical protein
VIALFVVMLLSGACQPAKEATLPTVSLRLTGGAPEASVTVDDEPIGSFEFVASRGVALPPGVHHVTVTAQGYFPWDREVDAKLGAPPIVLGVALTHVPD